MGTSNNVIWRACITQTFENHSAIRGRMVTFISVNDQHRAYKQLATLAMNEPISPSRCVGVEIHGIEIIGKLDF